MAWLTLEACSGLGNSRFYRHWKTIARTIDLHFFRRNPITRSSLNHGKRNRLPPAGTSRRRRCAFSTQRYFCGYAASARIQRHLARKIGRHSHGDLSRRLLGSARIQQRCSKNRREQQGGQTIQLSIHVVVHPCFGTRKWRIISYSNERETQPWLNGSKVQPELPIRVSL